MTCHQLSYVIEINNVDVVIDFPDGGLILCAFIDKKKKKCMFYYEKTFRITMNLKYKVFFWLQLEVQGLEKGLVNK